MSDQGTNSDKVNLSIPKTDDEYQSAMNKAVNEGNEEEINRLMSIELPGEPDPYAKAVDTDKSKEGQNGEAPVLADSDKGDDKKPDDSASKDAPPDPVATKLAAMEQELNNLRAQAGRVSALQSKISELERERQHASIAKSVVKEKEKPDPADEKITSKIKELAEVDKSTAELLEDMYKEIKQGRHSIDPEELARRLSAEASEREQTQHLQREFEKVVQVHPDFDNIRRHPYWHMWKDRLTPEQRSWAESSESSQVIEAVKQYKNFLGSFAQPSQKPPEQQTPQADGQQQDAAADAAKAARDQKLAASAKGADTAIKDTKQVLDEEAIYQQQYRAIMKEYGLLK